MTPDQFAQIQMTIKDQLTEIVPLVVDGQISNFETKFDIYVEKDMEWKRQAQPSIDLGRNLNGFGRVLAYFLATIAGIYGIIRIFR